jgi:hypothetical protein
MLDQSGIAGIDHRIVIAGMGNADLQVVRDNLGRYPAEEGTPRLWTVSFESPT